MNPSIRLSESNRQDLMVAINFWFDNVRQEDTDESTWYEMLLLKIRLERMR
jgi:hypothetical protein